MAGSGGEMRGAAPLHWVNSYYFSILTPSAPAFFISCYIRLSEPLFLGLLLR